MHCQSDYDAAQVVLLLHDGRRRSPGQPAPYGGIDLLGMRRISLEWVGVIAGAEVVAQGRLADSGAYGLVFHRHEEGDCVRGIVEEGGRTVR